MNEFMNAPDDSALGVPLTVLQFVLKIGILENMELENRNFL